MGLDSIDPNETKIVPTGHYGKEDYGCYQTDDIKTLGSVLGGISCYVIQYVKINMNVGRSIHVIYHHTAYVISARNGALHSITQSVMHHRMTLRNRCM